MSSSMPVVALSLPEDPREALQVVTEQSRETPVLVFKKSPTCPISHHAESQFREWLTQAAGIHFAEIDVIAERPLARGLTAELDITHQSPQALLFAAGELVWHDSHMQLNVDRFHASLELANARL